MKKVSVLFLLISLVRPCLAYDFEVNGIYYTIESIEDKTVFVDKGESPYTGDIKIPSSVVFKEKEMKVVGLNENSFRNSDVSSIEIAEGVLKIGSGCFHSCKSLKNVKFANSIKSIGDEAFYGCISLSEIIMPSSLNTLGLYCFQNCISLDNVIISTSLENLGRCMFYGCDNLKYLKIPKTIKKIGPTIVKSIDILEFEEGQDSLYCEYGFLDESTSGMYSAKINGSFSNCLIKKIILGRNLSYIEGEYNAQLAYNYTYNYQPPFYKCISLKSLVIKDNVGKLPPFDYSDIDTIVCKATTPIEISENTFSHKTYVNGTLYVPKGSKKMYEEAVPWKNFFTIVENSGGETNGITDVRALAVMIQNEGGQLIISGTDDDTQINVYNLNGLQAGSAISRSGSAVINTNIHAGSVVIVKIGEKSRKVIMK